MTTQTDNWIGLLACTVKLFHQSLELVRPARLRGFAKFPAHRYGIGEEPVRAGKTFHPRKYQVEMVFKQVLKEARCNALAEVFVRVLAPTFRKGPHSLWIGFDEFSDGDDRLPTRILFILRRSMPREKLVGAIDGFGAGHVNRQANARGNARGGLARRLRQQAA